MVYENTIIVRLVKLIDSLPEPEETIKRGRGRVKKYSEKLMLKALIIMIIRRLYSAYALLSFLEQDDPVIKQLCKLLREKGEFPSRRTWERRLAKLSDNLPNFIGYYGRYLVDLLKIWDEGMEIVSCDSTALRTGGGVWHKKDRQAGHIPHTTIDVEANWSKSGWHGWWYGWKLHLAIGVGNTSVPLAAQLTTANTYDATIGAELFNQLPDNTRFVLGDKHYNDPELQKHCQNFARSLITPLPGAYPHTDSGVGLRRIFHKLRSQSIEPFNGLFKSIFDWRSRLPFKGLLRSKLFALGAIFLYQLVLLFQFKHNLTLGVGIKPLLRAA